MREFEYTIRVQTDNGMCQAPFEFGVKICDAISNHIASANTVSLLNSKETTPVTKLKSSCTVANLIIKDGKTSIELSTGERLAEGNYDIVLANVKFRS